jgi:type VI protein secretion system component VasK
MPSSLILTVLAAQNFRSHERDDVSLANTARGISDSVRLVFCVYNPVDGTEELTARLSDEEKKRFQDAIADLANDASKAVNNDSPQEASKLWRAQLGDRFPLVQEEDDDAKQRKEDAMRLATFYTPKKPIKPWGWS